ncbi:MAG: DUF2079 domain-containing protein [Bacteroidia bacterium]
MSVFAVIYFTTAIGNHYFFRTAAFDYGTYNFAFWDYAHFHVSKCPVYFQNMNFLQDHFSLTLMYFVPLYWVLNWLTGTYTLCLIQVTMLLVGGWATYRLIILKTSDVWLGIAALLYYFLLQGHFSAFAGECNVAVISAAFIPMFLYYFELKKYVAAAVIFVLAIFSRENMPLWFVSILPVVMLWHRKDKNILIICTAYIIVSLFYFALLFKVIIPHLETADKKYSLFNYSALGASPFEAFKFVLHHPLHTLKLFFINHTGDTQYDGIKAEFYIVYFISGGFILFWRPQYFIWFIPLIAQKMLNDEPNRWSIMWHYVIEVATMLPIAVFIIISSLKNKKIMYALSALICMMTSGVTWYKMNDATRAVRWSGTEREILFAKGFFSPDYDVDKINKTLSLIPPDASVSASASILPHLAQRKAIYVFPKVNDTLYGEASYIAAFSFFDYAEAKVTVSDYNYDFYKYVFSPAWTIIADDYPFVLFKKEPKKTVPKFDSITCNNEVISDDKKYLVASDGEMVSGTDTRDSSKARHGKYSCRLTKDKPFGMTLNDSTFSAGTILAVSIWRYSDNNDGALVISCGKDFYQTSNVPQVKDSLGWQQLFLYVVVPPDHSNFRIYTWNTGDTPVWFDDLKILKCRDKLL